MFRPSICKMGICYLHHLKLALITNNLEYKQLECMAGFVIQAKRKVKFEDRLQAGVLVGDYWYPWGSRTYPRINFKPP